MISTPNEIWCETGLYYDYKTDWSEGSWTARRTMTGEKYVRADRIEELEAKLAKALEALGSIADDCESDYPPSHGAIKHYARTSIEELKGETK